MFSHASIILSTRRRGVFPSMHLGNGDVWAGVCGQEGCGQWCVYREVWTEGGGRQGRDVDRDVYTPQRRPLPHPTGMYSYWMCFILNDIDKCKK